MSNVKTCTTCGKIKSLEHFRLYPKSDSKRYPYCLECQRIETRRRYLVGKIELGLTIEEAAELNSIEQLYDLRVEKGLKTLGSRKGNESVKHLVDQQMHDLNNMFEIDECI